MANLNSLTLAELKVKLTAAQVAFRTAEATYKAAESAADVEFSQVDYESQMAEAEVEQIERRYGLTAKSLAASRAQHELVAVCQAVVMTHPATAKRYKANAALLGPMFEREAYKRHAWSEEQMMKLCLSLAI